MSIFREGEKVVDQNLGQDIRPKDTPSGEAKKRERLMKKLGRTITQIENNPEKNDNILYRDILDFDSTINDIVPKGEVWDIDATGKKIVRQITKEDGALSRREAIYTYYERLKARQATGDADLDALWQRLEETIRKRIDEFLYDEKSGVIQGGKLVGETHNNYESDYQKVMAPKVINKAQDEHMTLFMAGVQDPKLSKRYPDFDPSEWR